MPFKPGPNGYPTDGLRDDGRQWLIYGSPQQEAIVKGVEAMGLMMTGMHLAGNPMREVRATGNFMIKIGQSRIQGAIDAGGYRHIVMEYLVQVMQFAAGNAPPPSAKVLDELHALVFQTDTEQRLQEFGETVH